MAIDREPEIRAGAQRDSGGITTWLIGFLVAVGLIIGGLLAWAALTDEDEGTEGLDVGVSANDITSDPEEYYGVDVTVSGEVNEVVGPNAFTIGGEGFIGGAELLIVSAQGVTLPQGLERGEDESVLEDDIIQVTGQVMQFDIAAVEDQAGIDLDDTVFEEFAGEPAIVAQNVTLSPRVGNVPTGAITIEQIADNEELFNGQQVSLNGEVMELVGQAAFLISDAREVDDAVAGFEESLLVIGAPDAMPDQLVEDVPVEVTGTVRVFGEDEDAAGLIEEEFGIEVENGLLDGWDDEPVLIANQITTGALTPIDIERIMTDALAYVGQQVTTGGVVQESFADTPAFVLTSEDEDAVVEVEVLVVSGTGTFDEAIVDQAFVQVTGTPYIWDTEFEDEFGDDFGFLFEDEAFDDFEGGVVIVADSLQVAR